MLNNLISYVKNFIKSNKYTELDLNILPSMNLFYDKFFNIEIRALDKQIIDEYNNTNFNNPFDISRIIYKILKYSVRVPDGYTVSDILCCDIMFIFFEIVKITKGEKLYFRNNNRNTENLEFLEFNHTNYDYYKMPEDIKKMYNAEKKCINIDGYEFRLPRYKFDQILMEYILDNDMSTLNYIIVAYFSHYIKNKISLERLLIYNDVLFDETDSETIDKMQYVISHLSNISKMTLTDDIIEVSIIDSLDMKTILK